MEKKDKENPQKLNWKQRQQKSKILRGPQTTQNKFVIKIGKSNL